jgi:hypothetical protein
VIRDVLVLPPSTSHLPKRGQLRSNLTFTLQFDFRYQFAYSLPVSANAWVVECTTCKCVIVCFARDPQSEHGRSATDPPGTSAVLQCLCCGSAYRYGEKDIVRGTPRRNPACLRKQTPKQEGALLIAASIVAAIRLRGEPITHSPKVTATVADSLQLARMVMARLERG